MRKFGTRVPPVGSGFARSVPAVDGRAAAYPWGHVRASASLRSVRWPLLGRLAAVAWVAAGTLLGGFTTFIAFDHTAIGRAILDGVLPYRDFTFEYPPGAAAVLAVPATAGRDAYDIVFRLLMFATWGAMALTIRARLARGLGGFLVASVGLTFVIGAGFDIVVAASILAAFLVASSAPMRSAVWLGLGTVVKLVPTILAPLVVRSNPRSKLAGIVVVAAVAVGAAIGVPALLADEGQDPVRYHAGRLLHAESAIGSVVVLQRVVVDDDYPVVFDHGSRNVAGAPSGARTASLVLMAIALAMLWIRGRADAPATWMATLLAIPALGPVASPQFLLWPLAFAGLVRPGARWAYVAAGVLSASMFTGPYPEEGTALAVLTVMRNLALLTAFAFSAREALQRATSQEVA